MNSKFYKGLINTLPFLRGGALLLFTRVFYRNVFFGRRLRIKSSTELKFFPGCFINAGRNLVVGKDVTISVLPYASLSIGDSVGIGNRCQIVCHRHIEVGEGTIMAPNVMLYDHNHIFDVNGVQQRAFTEGEIVVGKHCWLGAGSIILQDVHIGDNCVIGAGSVVTKDIPSGCLAAGIPARIIKNIV